MAYTHNDIRKMLAGESGKELVRELTVLKYPEWAPKIPSEYFTYRQFAEFTIRYSTDQLTRLGLPKNELYRLDSVLFVEPGYRARSQGYNYTIGIEIKDQLADLRQDDKIGKYLGWTNYLVLVVPTELVEAAREKIDAIDGGNFIGIYDVERHFLVTPPLNCEVAPENEIKMLREVTYKYMFGAVKQIDATDAVAEPRPVSSEEKKAAKLQRTIENQAALEEYDPETKQKLEQLPQIEQAVYNAIESGITKKGDIAATIGASKSSVSNAVNTLKQAGLIDRVGSDKTGSYEAKGKKQPKFKFAPRCLDCCALREHYNRKKKAHCLTQEDEANIEIINAYLQTTIGFEEA